MPKKLNGTVIVTYRCNARCTMCNRYKCPSKPDEEISIQTINKLPKMYFTNITGGEPFIREDLEEERRLCYVAITRAKKHLYLVNTRKRMIFGDNSFNQPSRFINEINDEYLNKEEDIKDEKKFDKDAMIDDTIEYSIGDKVVHDTYGEGIIVMLDKSIITKIL